MISIACSATSYCLLVTSNKPQTIRQSTNNLRIFLLVSFEQFTTAIPLVSLLFKNYRGIGGRTSEARAQFAREQMHMRISFL